ncbi:MAG: DUF1223 domain-containing protein [Rubrivivax sp.]|nr:DUF1223 domain-containing protein [Pyrinomonadaceae bacterium]
MRKLFAGLVVVIVLAVFAVAINALNGQKNRKPSAPPRSVGDASADASGKAVGKRAPVIVELFTSEGCSSCPSADAVLAKLEREQPVAGAEVIPLALHVDYWNYLGWSDPFSSHDFSARQGEYASAYGKDGVYTPQMIVDGVKEFPGGNSRLALDTIAKAALVPKADVQITRSEAQPAEGLRLGVHIENLPKPTAGDEAFVLLVVTESNLSTDVARGENAGRKLSHVGVVRRMTTLGALAGARDGKFDAEAIVSVEKNWRRENLRAVVFAQERGSRRVLAAGTLKLF